MHPPAEVKFSHQASALIKAKAIDTWKKWPEWSNAQSLKTVEVTPRGVRILFSAEKTYHKRHQKPCKSLIYRFFNFMQIMLISNICNLKGA